MAWRNRNQCGEKLFEKLLSAPVSGGNVRGEKLFAKLLSAQWWPRRPFRAGFGWKRLRTGAPGPPRSHFWAILRRFRLVTCANWHTGHDIRGEKLFEKLLSAQVSGGNVCGEKLLKKLLSAQVSASPSRAKKEPKKWVAIMMTTNGHHDGHWLPS